MNNYHNEQSLFITEKLANRFLTLKHFGHYNNTGVENLLFNIFMKTIDNDSNPNDELLSNYAYMSAYIGFYDDTNHKRKSYYDIQKRNIINSYNKKLQDGNKPFYSIENTISRIKYKKSSSLSYKICIAIAKDIVKLKVDSTFAMLFVSICKYVFTDEANNKIFNNSNMEYNISPFANVQFLAFKESIDKSIQNYKTKIEKSKSKKDNK